MKERYVVITPVRDEERYIASTIESVVHQTVVPTEWIIVDDGSKDSTARIVESYASRYPWLRLVRREDRGFRLSGAGVVDAFYAGFRSLATSDWDFLVKLDGDLSFDPHYFARLLEQFEKDPKLGIAGGSLFHSVNGSLQLEKCPRFHVRGATKMYRAKCWKSIGGLQPVPGWDIVDEVKANMLGWTTQSFDIEVTHHRLTGTAESKWTDQVKNGRAYYVAGYHPLFMAAKCLYRTASRPYLLGALAMARGYLTGYTHRLPQVDDPALIHYLRRQQLRKLLGGSTIWK